MTHANNPRVLVTGASGGAGSIGLAILKQIGYTNVTAMIRKDDQEELVKKLGATDILWAQDIDEKRPLISQKYDFILDTVGGEVAAILIPQIQANGSFAMCGNAGGVELNTTVLPFILRGINILEINTIFISHDYRLELWEKMATDWNVVDKLVSSTVKLEEMTETVNNIKNEVHLGRTIIEIN
ncbi:zinc-binding dehydrogenase [Ruoffia sp. FAM 26254]|uniref:zinc-binding dehydrogenase n=1 Tax=Ruoffia sp. FAM 26254 TaxID=3259518 RepID=UPI003884E716